MLQVGALDFKSARSILVLLYFLKMASKLPSLIMARSPVSIRSASAVSCLLRKK
jgi:hypothetical protein